MICPDCCRAADAGTAHACSTPGCTCRHRTPGLARPEARMRCPYCMQPTDGGRAHIERCANLLCPAYTARKGDVVRRCARERGHYISDREEDAQSWHSENPAGPDARMDVPSGATWATWSNWAEGAMDGEE